MIDINYLNKIVDDFDKSRILVIGDIMLDKYIVGTASRISPEAPVPVLDFESESFKLGGAANASNNIRSLGGTVFQVGIVGFDSASKKLCDLLKRQGIITEGIFSIKNRVTSIKTRLIAGQQQIVRIDKENKNDIGDRDTQRIFEYVSTIIEDIDAILISDYDKGIITKKLLDKVIPLAHKNNKPIIVDPKDIHFLDYKGVTVVTPNLHEASYASRIRPKDETSIRNMGQWLLNYLKCEAIFITRGKDGISLFEKDGSIVHIPTINKEIFDVTGAGDTVTSVVALGLAVDSEMKETAIIANIAAGFVIGRLGPSTVTKDEIKNYLEELMENDLYRTEQIKIYH